MINRDDYDDERRLNGSLKFERIMLRKFNIYEEIVNRENKVREILNELKITEQLFMEKQSLSGSRWGSVWFTKTA